MSFNDLHGNYATSAYNSIPQAGRFKDMVYSQRLIRSLIPRLVAMRMFTMTSDQGVCGNTVARRNQMTGAVQPCEDNGFLKPMDFVYPSEDTMDIEYGCASSRKFSESDEACLMANDEDFIGELLRADEQAAMEVLDSIAIRVALANINKHNKGVNAGRESGLYQFGTPNAPLVLDDSTVEGLLNHMGAALNEWHFMSDSRPFLITPSFFQPIVLGNERLTSYYHQGNCNGCPLITGAMENMLFGFEIYQSSCIRSYRSAKGAYPLIFGYQDQGDISVNFRKRKMKGTVPGDWSVYYESKWDFGVKSWDDRKLGVAWVTPSLT